MLRLKNIEYTELSKAAEHGLFPLADLPGKIVESGVLFRWT